MRPRPRQLLASRREWNDLVRGWYAARLLGVTVLDPAPWRWPWHASLRWDPLGEQWTVSVLPGWCESPSGSPSPSVSVPLRLAGSRPASAAEAREETDPDEIVEALLADGPRVPVLSELWRAEGTDAVGGADSRPLPEVIVRRGVLPPDRVEQRAGGLVRIVEGVETDRRTARLARAVELVLEHGRETLEPSLRIESGQVVLAPAFRPASPAAPRVRLLRSFVPARPRPRFADVAAGLATDDGVERLRIATLWLTSPPGESPGSVPDARWTPWVQQRLRRNVAYEVVGPELRTLPPFRLAPAAAGLGVLGAGAAVGVIGPILEELDARSAEIEAALSQLRTSGEFVEF